MNDRQVLRYYAQQTETHASLLINAIDAFFLSVDQSNSPKTFIGMSKQVVIAAHRMVYVGDAIQRSIHQQDIRDKVLLCAASLCEGLKQCVIATKIAALNFPLVVPLQEMLDRVVDVSHAAQELKLVIIQAATL